MNRAQTLSTSSAKPALPVFSLRDARREFERRWKGRNPFKKYPRSLDRTAGPPAHYVNRPVNEEWDAFLYGARWRAPQGQPVAVPASRILRRLFAAYWTHGHPVESYDPKLWLKRDDIWRKGGYRQPVVHWAWESFAAGMEWSASLATKRPILKSRRPRA